MTVLCLCTCRSFLAFLDFYIPVNTRLRHVYWSTVVGAPEIVPGNLSLI
jgi:hypothetical protein